MHLKTREDEIVIPDWIMDPQIRAEAAQLMKYALKYETIDIRDVIYSHHHNNSDSSTANTN
jgi:hypothetical protein